jgi:hypothetical protein
MKGPISRIDRKLCSTVGSLSSNWEAMRDAAGEHLGLSLGLSFEEYGLMLDLSLDEVRYAPRRNQHAH